MDAAELTAKIMEHVPGRQPRQGAVAVTLRAGGAVKALQWRDEQPAWQPNLEEALARLMRRHPDGWPEGAALEINLTYDFTLWTKPVENIGNSRRGIDGLRLRYIHGYSEHRTVFPPTSMLARNVSYVRAQELFREEVERAYGHFHPGNQRTELFSSRQYLVRLKPFEVMPMYRGARIVAPEEVTPEGMRGLADRMGEWMINNVHEDGRLTYIYWPSRGQETTSINLIRVFMGTNCLFKMAKWTGDARTLELAKHNLRYHLAKFYRQEGALGYVIEEDRIKLGSCALAGMAIEELEDESAYRAEREGFQNMVLKLWSEDGSFRTFYRPAERNDDQNFYPGEALLYWATLWRKHGDPVILDRILRSYAYYREYHLNNRHPAFIPWHTQAYFLVWEATRDERLKDFIFEMNDWLLPIQQWDNLEHPDAMGRFYDPARPFGRPHASATGVYVEGLIDAYRLARLVDDDARALAYATAIRRATRSLMQLQYKDELDMFYVSNRKAVYGGLRTDVYDNEIRVDNIQHGLMGLIKVLESDLFSAVTSIACEKTL